MKPLTFKRGAWLACAFTLLSTLLLASPGSALAKHISKHKGASPNSFENTPVTITSGSAHASSGGAGGSIVRTIVGLAIVIAVIYGLYWILKQAKGGKNPASGYGLEQLASLPLGTGKAVSLVRVGEELHLLGISEHGITGIRVYTEEEAYELGLPLEPPEGGPSDPNAGLPPIQRLVEALRRITLR
ncbi:MAG TPA: flagellar biosynthetic protein FliO [Solirubrobacteraceae bacterium]|nr:flagellar biosynthetic protein FliO [Solirubrobacteraceae bacterium]